MLNINGPISPTQYQIGLTNKWTNKWACTQAHHFKTHAHTNHYKQFVENITLKKFIFVGWGQTGKGIESKVNQNSREIEILMLKR